MFQIHGGGLSRGSLQNYFVVSGIEALPSTRLYEAYFEKQWGNKKVSLKVGQLAADSEFFNTKYTDVLTNASMGWPAITSLDLPSGGPSPPLATMGARLLVNVTEQLSVLGGIFDGDQAGPGPGDPQERNRSGVNFRVNDPPLLLGQIQYGWNNTKAIRTRPARSSLAAGAILGLSLISFWRPMASHSLHPLAAANLCSCPVMSAAGCYSSRSSIVCRKAMIAASASLRASPVRSPTAISSIATPMPASSSSASTTRPDDKFGIAAGYAHVSKRAQRPECGLSHIRRSRLADAEFRRPTDSLYQYQIRDGWTLQPNIQYIIHPGGGATSPSSAMPGKALHNATVLGLRTTLKF
jgi:porin